MGKPRAEEVATALWILTLLHVMKGTEINAPPAPTRDDRLPIKPPTLNIPAKPGSTRLGLGLRFKNICVAEKATKTAKSTLKILPGSATASCAPINEPNKIPGASAMATGHSTAPRLWCAQTDEIEVKQMVANEVATAIFTMCSVGKPLLVNMKVMKGTINMPPPMPSKPAKKPVHRPSVSNSTTSTGSNKVKNDIKAVMGKGCL